MIIEASVGHLGAGEVVAQVGAAAWSEPGWARAMRCSGEQWRHVLVLLVLVDDLDAMVVLFSSRLVADRGEVAVHDMMGLVAGEDWNLKARQV